METFITFTGTVFSFGYTSQVINGFQKLLHFCCCLPVTEVFPFHVTSHQSHILAVRFSLLWHHFLFRQRRSKILTFFFFFFCDAGSGTNNHPTYKATLIMQISWISKLIHQLSLHDLLFCFRDSAPEGRSTSERYSIWSHEGRFQYIGHVWRLWVRGNCTVLSCMQRRGCAAVLNTVGGCGPLCLSENRPDSSFSHSLILAHHTDTADFFKGRKKVCL